MCKTAAPLTAGLVFGLLLTLLGGCAEREPPPFERQRQETPFPEQMFDQARAAFQAGDHDGARRLLVQVPERSAEIASAHNLLGMILAARDSLDAAMDAFKAALDRNPDLALAHNNLGAIYAMHRRHSLAEVAFAQAVALDADYPEPREGLALQLLQKGRLEDARLALRRARALRGSLDETMLEGKRAASLQSLPVWPWKNVRGMIAAERRRRAETEAAAADTSGTGESPPSATPDAGKPEQE